MNILFNLILLIMMKTRMLNYLLYWYDFFNHTEISIYFNYSSIYQLFNRKVEYKSISKV